MLNNSEKLLKIQEKKDNLSRTMENLSDDLIKALGLFKEAFQSGDYESGLSVLISVRNTTDTLMNALMLYGLDKQDKSLN